MGFSYGVSDVVKLDSDRYSFTLLVHHPDTGDSIVLRGLRLVRFNGQGRFVVNPPVRNTEGGRIRLVTFPAKMRREIAKVVFAKVRELARQEREE